MPTLFSNLPFISHQCLATARKYGLLDIDEFPTAKTVDADLMNAGKL